jgi:molybdopterin converting factor small subunit
MILQSIHVTLKYDGTLQVITGRPSDPVVLSEGAPFSYLLFNLFQSYPEIERQYPPGTLGFAINGQRPGDDTVLADNDVVEFTVVEPPAPKSPKEVLLAEETLRSELGAFVDRYRLTHSVEQIEQLIFEEKDMKDFNRYIEAVMVDAQRRPKNLDEMNAALQLLSRAWNELPHASLDGQSPAQSAAMLRAESRNKKATKKPGSKRKRG